MTKVYYFGKLRRNSNGEVVVALPTQLSNTININRDYTVIFEECSFIEKITSKYRDVNKVCVRTKPS